MKMFSLKINCLLLVFVFLPYGSGEGFFSRLTNRGRHEIYEENKKYAEVCETVKVLPRIAMAVVGGAPLRSENSAPYIAAVGERLSNGSVSWFCGGSLISSKDVLTAAHCLISRNVTTIRVGSFSTKKKATDNDYEITETIIHPGYKITESYNDIAIIKVKEDVSFSANVKPVCLPQDDSNKYEREQAKVIGWGAEEFGGEGSQKLQQVQVEIFSNDNCEKSYMNSTIAPKTFPKGIKREQLCAGSSRGGKDACQGDSGGPLVLSDDSGIVRQIGIVSTGAGCGMKKYPGVYTRVSSYIKWIQEQVKKTEYNQSSQSSSSSGSSGSSGSSSNSRTSTNNQRETPNSNSSNSRKMYSENRNEKNYHRSPTNQSRSRYPTNTK